MRNYFDFYGIDESLDIDLSGLRSIYIANSKKYHPDYHTLKSAEEQEHILELSTINNEAWKTLSDRSKRIAHLLNIHGVMPEEGKAQIPQDFLIDMMEINEALMELEFEDDPKKKEEILSTLDSLNADIESTGASAMSQWNQDKKKTSLEAVREYYLKLKYINRIRERLNP